MPDAPLVLATAEEIRAIFQRARVAVAAIMDRDDDEDGFDAEQYRTDSERLRAAVEALRFCCIAAGQLGDPALLPLVAGALDVRDGLDGYAEDDVSAMAGALSCLLRAGAPVGPEVKALAADDDPRVRAAVAAGLPPRGERELALLDALATDAIAEVRNAAKRALSTVREVAWWKGKFASDPVARLSAEEALALKPRLEALSALLDEPRYQVGQREPELCALAVALPDALLVELTETVHCAGDAYSERFAELLAVMLARPGGPEALKRLCAVWSEDRSSYVTGGDLAPIVAALPREVRAALCRDFAAEAAAFPEKVRCGLRGGAARILAEIAAEAWPPGEDLTPLLEVLLSIPHDARREHRLDWVIAGLRKVFEGEDADPAPVLGRILEARLAGYPGPWRRISFSVDALLQRADGAALRPAAERAILGADDDSVAWGLLQLVGAAHDPARDAPAPEMLARFLAVPRYRAAVLGSDPLRKRALSALRVELRAGRLELVEACEVMSVVGVLYGGVAMPALTVASARNDTDLEESRAEMRAEIEAFLGPPGLRCPPTLEEWAEVRAARRRRPPGAPGDDGLDRALRALPEGPWSAEDRELLDEAWARFRDGEGGLALALATALAAKPAVEDLPLIDELIERGDPRSRKLLRLVRGTVRELLGLPRKPPAAGAPAAGEGEGAGGAGGGGGEADAEWMDEAD